MQRVAIGIDGCCRRPDDHYLVQVDPRFNVILRRDGNPISVAHVVRIEQVERTALTLFSRDVAEVALIVLNPPVSLSQIAIVVNLRQMLQGVHCGHCTLAVHGYSFRS